MLLPTGTRLGPYEIAAPLGAGGMGEVYRARDTRLGRDVALKVLSERVAAHPELLARFELEAKTVAALNHPNIVVLHSIEEADGIRFLTMELVEGQSLDRLVAPGGLPAARVLDLALPLAEALAAAHERGVIHRDLKPANVMVTREGRVKVLDFGLAKVAAAESNLDATQAATLASPISTAGQVVGTAPYMSPEQLRGEPVDARTDLFALGILVYELAAGRRPFTGATLADITSSILRDTPEPLQTLRADLPGDLGRIVGRCLEKDPALRIQTALDVRNELERLRRGLESAAAPASRSGPAAPSAAASPPPSVAVLPFASLTADPEDDYFSDGITEEIINALGRLPGLRVAARTSCFAFKGKHEDLREIGAKLSVGTVLEGSVRKAGSRLRITTQLVNVADGYQLWSERYDREFTDVFAIQDEIASAIAARLRLALAPPGSEAVARPGPRNQEAFELFLKGRVLQTRRGGSILESLACFQRAVELDPELTEAQAWLADAYRLLALYGIRPAREAMPLARAAAERALARDPAQVEGLATLACIQAVYDWDFEAAVATWDRALALNPAHVRALAERSLNLCLFRPGNIAEALRDTRRAAELDSLNAWAVGMYALNLGLAGRSEEAVSQARHAAELDSGNFMARWALVEVLMLAGKNREALSAAEPALAMSGRHPYVLCAVAGAQAALGNRAAAGAIYQELLGRSRSGYIGFAFLAATAAAAGQPGEARRLAARGVEEREGMLVFWTGFPEWAAFRADPGCADVLKRAGL